MTEKCGGDRLSQEYPKDGQLKDHTNLRRNELLDKLGNERGTIYAYVLCTVENENHKFSQKGCGPNFQGGLVTLCTCKHFMRTWRDVLDWKGIWIAGLTKFNLMEDGKNYLFYLMKVSESFHSQKEIWNSLSPKERNAKNAGVDPLGDIYEPKDNIQDEFDPSDYHAPKNHVHLTGNQWHKDINYVNRYGKRPALLVGDTKYSFLWSLPIISLKSKHPRIKVWKAKVFWGELG